MLATDGELTYEKDTDRGQLFIRPVVLNKPINVRLISTSGATYNLILSAVDIPQEDVIIREPFAAKMDRAGTGGSFTASQSKRSGINPSQGKTIRDLVAVMALEEPPSTANVRAADEELALWENTRFVLTAIYQDRGLVGEKYTLTNTGKTQIRLVEQELYRKGVLAVAIENMNLAPGQSTSVYVVRAN
jgi:conjugal transfer pilus assembly protein TraK